LKHDEFVRGSLHQLAIGFRPPSLDLDVAALRPSELAEFFPKCRDPGLRFGVALVEAHQDTDPSHLVWLLRARRERPDGRAEERYELASPHCPPPSPDITPNLTDYSREMLAVEWESEGMRRWKTLS
jgi:hypothetical protein